MPETINREPTNKWTEIASEAGVKVSPAPHINTDTAARDLVLDEFKKLVEMYRILSKRQQTLLQEPETKSSNQKAFELLSKQLNALKEIERPISAKPTAEAELSQEAAKTFERP